jgi:hypothetical protein
VGINHWIFASFFWTFALLADKIAHPLYRFFLIPRDFLLLGSEKKERGSGACLAHDTA